MTPELAQTILDWEDHVDVDFYEPVTPDTITGNSRWSITYERIFKDKRDNTFWRIEWSRGATERQDEGNEGVTVTQVYPREVTLIEYVETP